MQKLSWHKWIEPRHCTKHHFWTCQLRRRWLLSSWLWEISVRSAESGRFGPTAVYSQFEVNVKSMGVPERTMNLVTDRLKSDSGAINGCRQCYGWTRKTIYTDSVLNNNSYVLCLFLSHMPHDLCLMYSKPVSERLVCWRSCNLLVVSVSTSRLWLLRG